MKIFHLLFYALHPVHTAYPINSSIHHIKQIKSLANHPTRDIYKTKRNSPMKTKLTLLLILITTTLFAQNGKIQSKELIDLSETILWRKIAMDGELKPRLQYLNQLNFYSITYHSDEHLVHGIITEPKAEGEFPVVIYNRGGNQRSGFKSKMQLLFEVIYNTSKLAEQGYVIVASNYREQDEFGGTDINDVLCLKNTIAEIPKANSNKIGMMGWSRGGMMTYMALKEVDFIQTAVIGNGPTELFSLIEERPEMETMVCAKLIPNYATNKEKELRNRSVYYWANQLHSESSLLLLVGTEDKRVNPNQVDKLTKKLDAIDYNYKIERFETDHKFSNKRKELNQALVQWFNSELAR